MGNRATERRPLEGWSPLRPGDSMRSRRANRNELRWCPDRDVRPSRQPHGEPRKVSGNGLGRCLENPVGIVHGVDHDGAVFHTTP